MATIETEYGHRVAVPGPWRSVAEIRRANAAAGHHWFEPGAMRFFRSRVGSTVYGGRLFVSSEQFVGSDGRADARRYSIRAALDDGSIEQVGVFQEHRSRAAAVAAIARILQAAAAESGDGELS